MRILFVLEHFYPYLGGAEHLFWTLAKALVQEGCEVAVVTTRFRKDLSKEETLEGIKIYRVDCYNRYFFSFFSLPITLRLISAYDIIHTTSYNAALPAWIAARIKKKPAIITFHEVWGKLWWKLPYASFLERLAFYSWEQLLLRLPFKRFIGVSEFTRQALIEAGISPQKAIRIYNGMEYSDFEGFEYRPPKNFTFTYFGRLGISKGLDLLLPAAAQHLTQHPNHQFKMIIPTYPKGMFDKIKKTIQTHGLEEQIHLLHHLPRKQLFNEICQSSCIVVPSYSEGFCFVAAEGVALGIPIISSQKAALAEVVAGHHITMNGQSIENLTIALNKAASAQWEYKTAQKFLLSDAVNEYIMLYKDLTSQ